MHMASVLCMISHIILTQSRAPGSKPANKDTAPGMRASAPSSRMAKISALWQRQERP